MTTVRARRSEGAGPRAALPTALSLASLGGGETEARPGAPQSDPKYHRRVARRNSDAVLCRCLAGESLRSLAVEAGFVSDRALAGRYPNIRTWLERVGAQPGHVTIDA